MINIYTVNNAWYNVVSSNGESRGSVKLMMMSGGESEPGERERESAGGQCHTLMRTASHPVMLQRAETTLR